MSLMLCGLSWEVVLSFLDDLLALGKTFTEHLETLRNIFQRFRRYKLKLKPKKCEIFRKSVEFLGRQVSEKGLEIGLKDVESVLYWP